MEGERGYHPVCGHCACSYRRKQTHHPHAIKQEHTEYSNLHPGIYLIFSIPPSLRDKMARGRVSHKPIIGCSRLLLLLLLLHFQQTIGLLQGVACASKRFPFYAREGGLLPESSLETLYGASKLPGRRIGVWKTQGDRQARWRWRWQLFP